MKLLMFVCKAATTFLYDILLERSHMDLFGILKSKIDGIPSGDHTLGLRSVLGHIDTAYRHLQRGQSQKDETAFTDAIYRTNQAFEGSVKEAYRVLAGIDPSRKTPHEIEKYLGSKSLLRTRVLEQFTNYRTNWRNPSTHDYKLDFDESEALMAIVSVSAFAIVLSDQIDEKLIEEKVHTEAKAEAKDISAHISSLDSLKINVEQGIMEFMKWQRNNFSQQFQNEVQVTAALSGFLSSIISDSSIDLEPTINYGDIHLRPDLIVRRNDEKVVIEVKRNAHRRYVDLGIIQLAGYLKPSGASSGVLFMYSDNDEEEYAANKVLIDGSEVSVVGPRELINNTAFLA